MWLQLLILWINFSREVVMYDVKTLYIKVAKYHNISVDELIRRITENSETLVHQYYVGVYGNDFI